MSKDSRARNIWSITSDDVAALIGRELTEDEYHAIVKSLRGNTLLTEIVTDTIYTFTEEADSEEEPDTGLEDDLRLIRKYDGE